MRSRLAAAGARPREPARSLLDPGIYDDDDCDDVVIRMVSGTGSVTPGVLDALGFTPHRGEQIGHAVETASDSLTTDAGHGRAPPAS